MSLSDSLPSNVRSALKHIEEVGISNLLDANLVPWAVPDGRNKKKKLRLDEADTEPLPPARWPHSVLVGLEALVKRCSNPAIIKAAIRRHVSIRQNNDRVRRCMRVIREVVQADLSAALDEIVADPAAPAPPAHTTTMPATSAPALTAVTPPTAITTAGSAPPDMHKRGADLRLPDLPGQVVAQELPAMKTSESQACGQAEGDFSPMEKLQTPAGPRRMVGLLESRWAPKSQDLPAVAETCGRTSPASEAVASSNSVELAPNSSKPTDSPTFQPGNLPPPSPNNVETLSGVPGADSNADLDNTASSNKTDNQLLDILKSYIDRLEIIKQTIGPTDVEEDQRSALASYLIASVKLSESTAELDASSTEALHGNYQELLGFNRTFLIHWRMAIEDSLRKL